MQHIAFILLYYRYDYVFKTGILHTPETAISVTHPTFSLSQFTHCMSEPQQSSEKVLDITQKTNIPLAPATHHLYTSGCNILINCL